MANLLSQDTKHQVVALGRLRSQPNGDLAGAWLVAAAHRRNDRRPTRDSQRLLEACGHAHAGRGGPPRVWPPDPATTPPVSIPISRRFERRGVSLVSVADSLDTRSAGRLVFNVGKRQVDDFRLKNRRPFVVNEHIFEYLQLRAFAPVGLQFARLRQDRQCPGAVVGTDGQRAQRV
jgi:hypothetical protein